MERIKPVLITILAFIIATLASLVSFGLILYLLWTTLDNELFYKTNPTMNVIAFSIFLGGFVLAWITKDNTHLKAAVFGFYFGLFGLLYFVGFNFQIIPRSILSTIFALGGSFLYHSIFPKYPKYKKTKQTVD